MRFPGIFRGGADLFWPLVCPVCQRELERRETAFRGAGGRPVLHGECLARLGPRASIGLEFGSVSCGVPVRSLCDDSPAFFAVLHAAKYGGDLSILDFMARLLASAARSVDRPVVVPMPDDPARLRARGASPVGVIAQRLARERGWCLDAALLRCRRVGRSQTLCSTDLERRQNAAGRLRTGDIARVPRRCPLLLVEDQVTSGATVREAVAILGARGNPVGVLALAMAARAPRVLVLDASGGGD